MMNEKSTEFLREVANAKWEAMNNICNMCIALCSMASAITHGFFGDAFRWHLEAQFCSVNLLRLYPLLLHDASKEDLAELGLINDVSSAIDPQ